MDPNQRLQHLVLVVSFVVLAVTGFALKFPDTWYARLMGSEEIRRWIHRIAGLVLLGIGIYHLGYVLAQPQRPPLPPRHAPRAGATPATSPSTSATSPAAARRHASDASATRRNSNTGPSSGAPSSWALTGLAIWFKIDVTHWLPRWVVEVAITIHYYEAILACLAIIVWHFYHRHLRPGRLSDELGVARRQGPQTPPRRGTPARTRPGDPRRPARPRQPIPARPELKSRPPIHLADSRICLVMFRAYAHLWGEPGTVPRRSRNQPKS